MNENVEIGRVLRANTTAFAVGCRVPQLEYPAFGSLVKAQPADTREAIYGLIYNMHVDDDPLVRRLVLAENPPESVIQDQRRNRLSPVEMSVLVVGYERTGRITHALPPRPPLNLDPVQVCFNQFEVENFTERLGYLRLVLQADTAKVSVSQLLVAHILNVYQQRGGDVKWTGRAIQELIELLRSNYDILIPTLEALSDALPILSKTVDF